MTGWEDSDEPERPLTRRQALTALGAGIGGGLLGAFVLPETRVISPERGQRPNVRSVDESADPIDESEHPYAVWQYNYEPDGEFDGFSTASPINLVSPLENADFDDIVAVFQDAGMTASPLEYTLYAWDRSAGKYRKPTWSGGESYFGLAGRFDVRCWELEGTASIQAHVDSPVLPKHEVDSYVRGQEIAESLFTEAGWSVAERIDFGNDKEPDHDGTVSVIRR
jgi:hypothetical protein